LKSKKSLYILFPIVLVIWGGVIFKTVAAFSDEPALKNTIEVPNRKESLKFVKKDTFSLLELESDPFLGQSYSKPAVKKEKVSVVKRVIDWPVINYLGLVSGKNKKSAIHILQINGNQFLLKSGETAEEVKVISSLDDKVWLSYKGTRKVLFKNK
jgi:type II secretory pathway component PulC